MISVSVVRRDATEALVWVRATSSRWTRGGVRRMSLGLVAVSARDWERREARLHGENQVLRMLLLPYIHPRHMETREKVRDYVVSALRTEFQRRDGACQWIDVVRERERERERERGDEQ